MIAWSIIHWKIFLLLFYSESNITISQRITNVESYLKTQNSWSLIFCPILITLAILLGYGILNSIGLFIKLLYDNWASPYIQRFIYNKNIIEKSKYEKVKSQYTTVQKDYDIEKENYINTEKEYREMKINFESFQNRSFEGQQIGDITQVFDKNSEWENFFSHADGRTGSETLVSSFEGFTVKDGTKIRVKDIKGTTDRRFLSFTKVIDERALVNFLIIDGNGNYYGIEDNNILVNYKRIKPSKILIETAKYGGEGLFYNITRKVTELALENIAIGAKNEIWGDPNPGIPKTLEVKYKADGIDKHLVIPEGESKKIE